MYHDAHPLRKRKYGQPVNLAGTDREILSARQKFSQPPFNECTSMV